MNQIVELCSAADEIEAVAICAALEEAGIRARTVGAGLGNAAGVGFMAWPMTPRIWVSDEDAPRARETLADWRDRVHCLPDEMRDGDEQDAREVVAEEKPCETSRRIAAIGRWFVGGFLCTVFAAYSSMMIVESMGGPEPLRAVIEAVLCLAFFGGLAIFVLFALKKRIRPKSNPVRKP
jgi:hypothetical protein